MLFAAYQTVSSPLLILRVGVSRKHFKREEPASIHIELRIVQYFQYMPVYTFKCWVVIRNDPNAPIVSRFVYHNRPVAAPGAARCLAGRAPDAAHGIGADRPRAGASKPGAGATATGVIEGKWVMSAPQGVGVPTPNSSTQF